jgi:two-component system, cell cycle sensor histidine kinase and response regulator CckA
MNPPTAEPTALPDTIAARTAQLFQEQHQNIIRHADRLFARLMICQWFFGVAVALWISPRTWTGAASNVHLHVWAAIILGGALTAAPVSLAIFRPGETFTRHAIAVGQMLMGALLIHLTGGRIETHFHVFGSLAILAFYRDWKVMMSATAVVLADHLLRGFFWPQSVYGVLSAPIWRSFEHAGWVVFEVTFLLLSIRKSLSEMQLVAERQARLEALKEGIEQTVVERTAELATTVKALVTENAQRKRVEQKLNIEYAVSRVLAESPSLEQAMREVLQAVGGIMNWDAGAFWAKDYRVGVLQCDEVWTAPNIEAGEFKTLSRQTTFAQGVGLPGRVWASGKPAWVRDVVEEANFPRSTPAKQAGLHGAFAFPIFVENNLAGVVEFFNKEIREPDDDLLQSFANVGNQLGQFFKRKRIEGHLFQSQRLETVGKLAGGVAHEFNSILTAIIGQSELLLGDLPADSPLGKNANEISKAANRAATLTRQLLAYGRKQMLRPETLDLNQVLASMENSLQHVLGRDVDVHIAPGAGLKAVTMDRGQIEQVIVNIAMNAAAVMPNGGKFTLETANITLEQDYVSQFPDLKAGDYVMLAMTDTGTGISPEAKKHIFEPFLSIKGVGQGTGLGLATCFGILKQSGGHINVYSELSRGATFKIYLPQVEPVAKAAAPSQGAPSLPRGTETILLVEDDPALREMASTLLGRLGYTVLAAADGLEALSLKHQQGAGHVDLLFTDVVMPHMSGKELADRVQSLYPRTRILFTSAYTENAIVHQGVLNKGVLLLQKPFTPSALARKVRDILDQPETAPAAAGSAKTALN